MSPVTLIHLSLRFFYSLFILVFVPRWLHVHVHVDGAGGGEQLERAGHGLLRPLRTVDLRLLRGLQRVRGHRGHERHDGFLHQRFPNRYGTPYYNDNRRAKI